MAALAAAALGGGGGGVTLGLGVGEAPWVMGIDGPEMPVADQAALVDRLACVPDVSAGFMAALLVQLANAFNLTGKATAYTSAAIDGAKVRWRVVRQVRYPIWWYSRCWWMPPQPGGPFP